MKNFLIGWEAVDQTVGVCVLIALLAFLTAWLLYGEHKYGSRR